MIPMLRSFFLRMLLDISLPAEMWSASLKVSPFFHRPSIMPGVFVYVLEQSVFNTMTWRI